MTGPAASPSTHLPPSIEAAKSRARHLRERLAAEGLEITHGQALELVAQAHGFRDWNSLHARIGNAPRPPVQLGQTVAGHYLKQPFLGEVIGVTELAPGRYEVTLHFAEPVDVVTFDSFSAFRSRIRKIVGSDGISAEKTSDGVPHLVIAL